MLTKKEISHVYNTIRDCFVGTVRKLEHSITSDGDYRFDVEAKTETLDELLDYELEAHRRIRVLLGDKTHCVVLVVSPWSES